MINTIIPSRITEARESRAMSMEELAKNVGVTRQAISKYECGTARPSPEVLFLLSSYLGFPADFFYKNELAETTKLTPMFFRSNSGVAKKVKKACTYQVKWADDIKIQLGKYVDFIEQDLPSIDKDFEDITDDDIEEYTLMIRKAWGLGEGPIRDLIGVVENRGVIVGKFAVNRFCSFTGVNGFSSWENSTPYILYNSTLKSAVRIRFSILHELGHLLLHSSIDNAQATKKEIIDKADAQADRFASAFLLPAISFPNDLRGTSIMFLEALKRKWGAAMSTIIKRSESLNLLTESQLCYIKRQMTIKKYWHKEPLDDVLIVPEPGIMRDAIYLLLENQIISKDNFISEAALPVDDIKHICSLPDDFFENSYERQKPILRVLGPNN